MPQRGSLEKRSWQVRPPIHIPQIYVAVRCREGWIAELGLADRCCRGGCEHWYPESLHTPVPSRPRLTHHEPAQRVMIPQTPFDVETTETAHHTLQPQ